MGKEKSVPPPGGAVEVYTCCGCRFPLWIAVLQLLLGVAIAALAFVMAAISPSLLTRETPHWAGISVCVVGLLGFILCCITYLPDEKTSLQFIAKLLYFLLCTVGLVLSLLVVAFSSHHYNQTSSFSCRETGEACVCSMDADDPIARTFTYAKVSDCSEVTGSLKVYFVLQIVLNLAQAFVCLAGAFIMWKHRYQVFFAGLQVDSVTAQQWQKV